MSHDDPREVYRALRGQLEPILRYLAKLQVRAKTKLPPGDDLCHRVDAVLEAMLALHGEVCDRAGKSLEALNYAQRLYELDPEDPQVRQLLEMLNRRIHN